MRRPREGPQAGQAGAHSRHHCPTPPRPPLHAELQDPPPLPRRQLPPRGSYHHAAAATGCTRKRRELQAPLPPRLAAAHRQAELADPARQRSSTGSRAKRRAAVPARVEGGVMRHRGEQPASAADPKTTRY